MYVARCSKEAEMSRADLDAMKEALTEGLELDLGFEVSEPLDQPENAAVFKVKDDDGKRFEVTITEVEDESA
jgi:hypothetical protein